MCGRFGFNTAKKLIAEVFGLDEGNLPDLPARYNIAPTLDIPVVRRDGRRKLDMLRWGWKPGWSKTVLVNARSESAAEKPTFRKALAERRCIIPASGFYEWKREKASKQAFWIHRKDDQPLAFAGLWTTEQDDDGNSREACLILTTGPNKVMEPIHDRMPVILAPDDLDAWLEGTAGFQDLMQPCPAAWLRADAVGSYVNSVKHQGPKCLEPV
ncbi:MAG: DUF159 family protein [Planctomycetota bacterium]